VTKLSLVSRMEQLVLENPINAAVEVSLFLMACVIGVISICL
jgi:hypothetical protein